jgi:hypothetical protein
MRRIPNNSQTYDLRITTAQLQIARLTVAFHLSITPSAKQAATIEFGENRK